MSPLCPYILDENWYAPWPFVAGIAALALVVEAVALAYSRRAVKGARRKLWLAIPVWGLGAWALLLTAWTWSVSSRFNIGPCSGPVQSWPVPPENALGVAELASMATALAAGILFVVGAIVVRRRLDSRRSSALD
jgi:energy-coupling factor transporter transmembrane protein EcfT